MQLQLIRNATLRVNYAGHTFLIDPYLGDKHVYDSLAGHSRNPTVDLPLTVDEILKDIEMVIVSHLHRDHFDEVAKERLPKNLHIFCEPGDVGAIMEHGFTDVKPIQTSLAWEGITIHRTPGQHGTGEWAKRMGTVSGFVFEADNEPTVYWTGDTIWYDAVKNVIQDRQPDIIITHSGGAILGDSDPIVMDEKQTVAVCQAAPHATVIATHMEALDHCNTSRALLRTYAHEKGISSQQLLIPEDGDILEFDE